MKKQNGMTLVFVCSGAADVGELTDRAARRLRDLGHAAMSCLASIGARDQDILFNADLAGRVLLIDGCPKACARRAFEQAGLHRFTHLELSQAGLLKGRSPATSTNVETVVKRVVAILKRRRQPPRKRPARRKA